MKHDFRISVAVENLPVPHDQRDLHVLPAVKWIFDPSFHYTPSYATDLRKTFERIRRQLQSQDCDGFASGNATAKNVLRLDSRKVFGEDQKFRPIIGPIAAAPSPSAASTSRPTIQNAGYSQPPSLFENSHPFLP